MIEYNKKEIIQRICNRERKKVEIGTSRAVVTTLKVPMAKNNLLSVATTKLATISLKRNKKTPTLLQIMK